MAHMLRWIGAAFFAVLASGQVFACKCPEEVEFSELSATSEVIVVGRVRSLVDIGSRYGDLIKKADSGLELDLGIDYGVRVDLVEYVFIKGEKAKIFTRYASDDCPLELEVGREYIIFATKEGKILNCRGAVRVAITSCDQIQLIRNFARDPQGFASLNESALEELATERDALDQPIKLALIKTENPMKAVCEPVKRNPRIRIVPPKE